MLQRQKSSEEHRADGLTVCTWNVLADCCCDNSDQGFPFVEKKVFNPIRRAHQQRLIVHFENADLLALQEVDKPTRFVPFLKAIGYRVKYQKRQDSPLGTLIAVKESLDFEGWSHVQLPENRFLLGAMLRYQGVPLKFYTTHLKAKANGAAARLLQVQRIVEKLADETTNYIVAGDFNDLPGSECVTLMKRAFKDAAEVRPGTARPYTTCKMRKGKDGKPDFQVKTEDYIFFGGPDLNFVKFENCIHVRDLWVRQPGLPSAEFPSDHLNIGAIFAVRPRTELSETRPPPTSEVDEQMPAEIGLL